MEVTGPVYLVILIIAFGTALFATIFSWQRRAIAGARTFAANSAFSALYALCGLLLIFSPTAEVALFSLQLRVVLNLLMVTTFTLFILDFAGYKRWLAPRRFWIFCIFPLFALIVALGSHFGDWFALGYSIQRQGTLVYEHYVNGPVLTLSLVYAFGLYIVLLIILGIQSLQVHPPFRWQVLILFAITLFTGFITIPSLSNSGEVYAFTVRPLTLQIIFRSVLITWALFSFRFLNILPIASSGIIAGLHSAVIVLDPQRRIVTMNPAALGLAETALLLSIGKAVQVIFPATANMFNRYNGHDEITEVVTVSSMGTQRYFEGRLYPLDAAGKRPVGHLLWLEDITQRKATESEREQLIADLNAYAHTVAHDLKNPIAIIAGYTDMILDPEQPLSDSERLEALAQVRRTSFKMRAIIDELLLLSSVRTQSTVAITPLDMEQIVKEALHRMEPFLKDSGAKVTVQTEWPVALGYAAWIEEVWVNLLSNAIKYGGTPPEIEIRAETKNEHVHFSIQDNGHGLTVDEQSKLFREFSRLSERDAEGHGIGLSIVSRIIEKLDGEVGVNSEIGKGSTFYFVLPGAHKDAPTTR
ncbi:MAG TPA: ATP-binding protein [Aggregatilineales bacterium]|nr:ATP-binding protein [Aggregatilineales bacterium]